MISPRFFKRYYPDDSKSGTLLFYNWLRSHIRPEFIVLNVGAGPTTDNKIRSLKGKVGKVVGVDIDNEVLKNKDLDEAFVIKNNKLPFSDSTFDLAWADFVFEHVEKPEVFLKEIYRVLKPSASFFFRTPNNYHYVSVIARMTPHWFHNLIANKVRGLPNGAYEPYPTYHRLNSKKDITKYSKTARFREIELQLVEAEPSYLMFHSIPFLCGVVYERIVNRFKSLSCIRANIFGRLEK
jgi:ubiquinone/menaquinone biosynthesis C-methylase UbiE